MITYLLCAIPALFVIGGVITTVLDTLAGKVNSKIHLED